jgi:SMC interacting uncharacterized protein involved in chromosome segregation
MLGLSMFAGLISAWWMFPVGLLFWLVMVIAVWRDPSLQISHQMQRRAPVAPRFQRYVDRLERSQVGVFNSLASAPPRTRRVLQPIQAEIDALTGQAYALCRRMTMLENYRLVSQSQVDLEADLRQIDGKIEETVDQLAKREYEESRRSLQDRLAKLETVSTQVDRVEAQLLSLANEMDSIVTEVIRLQAIGPGDASRHVPQLVTRLREQSTQLKNFEREAVDV